ncbi:unnamed protein product, partial [Vitis vinifera]
MMYDGPEISSLYWPNPDWDVFQNGRTNYNTSDMGFGCKVHGLCGRNGICIYTPEPKGSCPPGYEVSDPSDWSKGCKSKFNQSCSQTQQVKFVELPQTDYYGFDLNYSQSVSMEACRKICLDDCLCQGFAYRLTGEGNCYAKSTLFNGYKSSNFPGSLYLKLPVDVETSAPTVLNGSDLICESKEVEVVHSSSVYDTASKKMRWVYLYSFASAIGAIVVLFIVSGWWFVRVVKRKIQYGEDNWVEDTVDPRLKGKFSRQQAAMLVEIGISCVEEDRSKRPTMATVVQVLLECDAQVQTLDLETFCEEAPLSLSKMIPTTSPPQTNHSLVVSMGWGKMLTGFRYGSQIQRKELFDFPTDTLLPNQILTTSTQLISIIRRGDFSSGHFYFFFDNDNVLRMMYNGPDISSLYWPNPDWNVFGNGRTNYNTSDMGFGVKRRLTMDYDGNLRLYSLNHSTGLWVISWKALSEQCKVHGLCGRNGICIYTPEPKCSCPPGYEVSDPSDWSKGCKSKFNQSCSQTQHSSNFPGSLYLKLPMDVETSAPTILNGADPICESKEVEVVLSSSMYDPANKRMRWVYLYSFASAIGAMEILFIVSSWWFVRLVKRKIECGEDNWVEDTVDPRLKGKFSRHQAAKLIEIGISCVEEDGSKRPTMATVVQVLLECENEAQVQTLDWD